MSNTQSTKQEFKGELSAKRSMIEKKRNYPKRALIFTHKVKQVLQEVHNSKNALVLL
jgi:hypothetical protein